MNYFLKSMVWVLVIDLYFVIIILWDIIYMYMCFNIIYNIIFFFGFYNVVVYCKKNILSFEKLFVIIMLSKS